MKNRILLIIFPLVLSISAPLFSQTAARLEALLETPALTWEQAAAFIRDAANSESPDSEQKWLPKNASMGDIARLKGVALLLMRSFEIKGGIFYRIAKSPHHAYRELVYRSVIRGDTDPDMPVSGRNLLLMINRILAMREE